MVIINRPPPPWDSSPWTHSSSSTPTIVSCTLSLSASLTLLLPSPCYFVVRCVSFLGQTHFTPRNSPTNNQPYRSLCSLVRSLSLTQTECFAHFFCVLVFSLRTPRLLRSSSCTFFVQKLRTPSFFYKERKKNTKKKERKHIKKRRKHLNHLDSSL